MPAALGHDGPPRELGRYGGSSPGPLVICIGGMHGNEPAGVFAAQRVLDELRERDPPFRGRLVALAGNRAALARGCRFVTEDFNRLWLPERLTTLRARPAESTLNSEEAQCRELSEAIEAALGQHRGPVVFLDLHTTSAEGVPFVIVSDTLINRALALSVGAPVILGLEEQLDGTVLDYINDRGLPAVGFESGQNEAPSSIDHAEAALWAILVAAGCLREDGVTRAASARGVLRQRAAGIPRILEVRHRHAIEPADQFVMESGFVNFQPVSRGQMLARDRNGPIFASENARILFPLYQNQGSDGFFLVREVSPRWLRLSALVRGMGLERLLHLLPGIRRDPVRPHTLIVDTRVSRWLAVDLLHLFGYRRRRIEAGKIVVTRRPHDITSLKEW
jgi:predicted deacylase